MSANTYARARARVRFAALSLLACILISACADEYAAPANWRSVDETAFLYSVALPPSCTVVRSQDPQADRRFDATCPDGRLITLFVVRSKGVVDEERLSELADKSWAGDFGLVDTQYKPDVYWLLRWLSEDQIEGITKIYAKGNASKVIATQAKGRFGYFLVMDGKLTAQNDFIQIARTLKANISVGEVGFSFLYSFSAVVFAWILGSLGWFARKNRIKLKVLRGIQKRPGVNLSKVSNEVRKATVLIALTPFACAGVYAGGFYFLGHFLDEVSWAIFAFVGPFLPILGYFGIIREPSDDDVPVKI